MGAWVKRLSSSRIPGISPASLSHPGSSPGSRSPAASGVPGFGSIPLWPHICPHHCSQALWRRRRRQAGACARAPAVRSVECSETKLAVFPAHAHLRALRLSCVTVGVEQGTHQITPVFHGHRWLSSLFAPTVSTITWVPLQHKLNRMVAEHSEMLASVRRPLLTRRTCITWTCGRLWHGKLPADLSRQP